RAEIEDGATITGGANYMVRATSAQAVDTNVQAGSSGDTAVSPAVAVAVVLSDTTARAGTGTGINASGTIEIRAIRTLRNWSTGDGEAGGPNVAVGAAIAVNVVIDHALAETVRDLEGTSVTIASASAIDSSASTKAGTTGNASKDNDDPQCGTAGHPACTKTADQDASSSLFGNPNTPSTGSGGGLSGFSMPSFSSNTSQASSSSGGQSGTSSGGTGVAAAISVNIVSNSARVGASAIVTGVGVTVEAVTPTGERNDIIVWGLAAAGGKSDTAVAASIGVNVLIFSNRATVGAGATVTSTDAMTVA